MVEILEWKFSWQGLYFERLANSMLYISREAFELSVRFRNIFKKTAMNLNVSSTTHHIVEFMRCLLTEPSWIDCQFAFSWPVRFLQLILLRVFFSFKKIPRFTFACLLGQFVCGWPGASLRQHPKFQARSQSPRTPSRRGIYQSTSTPEGWGSFAPAAGPASKLEWNGILFPKEAGPLMSHVTWALSSYRFFY